MIKKKVNFFCERAPVLWYQTESDKHWCFGAVPGPEPIGSNELGRTGTCCCSLVSTTTQHEPVRVRSCSCTEIHRESWALIWDPSA